MPTANTRDCFREFVGQRLTGLLFDALPLSRNDLRAGNAHLIFEDGRALTISNRGSYWIEDAEAVRAAIAQQKDRLVQLERETAEVIAAAEGVGA